MVFNFNVTTHIIICFDSPALLKKLQDASSAQPKRAIIHALFAALQGCGGINSDAIPLLAGLQTVSTIVIRDAQAHLPLVP